jgi:transcriptional regulator with GAF, ATPase, and Fis domain
MRIWMHAAEGDHLHRLRQAFADADIQLTPYEWGHTATHGLVVVASADQDALAFLQRARYDSPGRILAIRLPTPRPLIADAWDLLDAGAADVVSWTEDETFLDGVVARFQRWQAVDELLQSPVVRDNLVGRSVSWIRVLRQVVEIARFTSASILVTGESGTGKELIARLVHTLDARPRKSELIVLDCTTVVPELSGSEFFGHERGAFTGAIGPRQGAFALANGGTLFLDEVGELPAALQAELLRVVQEHTYKPVGGNTWHRTEFRLVSASNRDLHDEAARGGFRRDLFYRLASWTCQLPRLSDRLDDIPLLAASFVRQAWRDDRAPAIGDDVIDYLMRRPYPGNIRELRQLVFRMVYRHVGRGPISIGDIPEAERTARGARSDTWQNDEFDRIVRRAVMMKATLRQISRAAEDAAIRIAVGEENGSWRQAADRLGVTGRALQMRRAAWRKTADARGRDG